MDHHPAVRPRFAVVSSPRSGNTWLRRLLAELFGLHEEAVHTPWQLDWDGLPERCVVQLHWPPGRWFTELLDNHGFHVCVLVRHPLDTLISILHFAGHEPETARWLDGAGGDERAILGADPCSQAIIEYATGPRARALIDVSARWWERDRVVQLRFEELIAQPVAELQRIVGLSGVQPVTSVERALEAVPLSRMKRETTNEHFWQGQPGLWRRLLPAKHAEAVAAPYRRHAKRFGYDLTPDPTLTVEAARREWLARARPRSSGRRWSPSVPLLASRRNRSLLPR
jgi:Sulfotransferase domain